jgi:hypothetical protein
VVVERLERPDELLSPKTVFGEDAASTFFDISVPPALVNRPSAENHGKATDRKPTFQLRLAHSGRRAGEF